MTQGAAGGFSPATDSLRTCLLTVARLPVELQKDLELGTEGTLMSEIDWVFLQARHGGRH